MTRSTISKDLLHKLTSIEVVEWLTPAQLHRQTSPAVLSAGVCAVHLASSTMSTSIRGISHRRGRVTFDRCGYLSGGCGGFISEQALTSPRQESSHSWAHSYLRGGDVHVCDEWWGGGGMCFRVVDHIVWRVKIVLSERIMFITRCIQSRKSRKCLSNSFETAEESTAVLLKERIFNRLIDFGRLCCRISRKYILL